VIGYLHTIKEWYQSLSIIKREGKAKLTRGTMESLMVKLDEGLGLEEQSRRKKKSMQGKALEAMEGPYLLGMTHTVSDWCCHHCTMHMQFYPCQHILGPPSAFYTLWLWEPLLSMSSLVFSVSSRPILRFSAKVICFTKASGPLGLIVSLSVSAI
jgi:hypothetical protein